MKGQDRAIHLTMLQSKHSRCWDVLGVLVRGAAKQSADSAAHPALRLLSAGTPDAAAGPPWLRQVQVRSGLTCSGGFVMNWVGGLEGAAGTLHHCACL